MAAWRVLAYSPAAFCDLVAEGSGNEPSAIKRKPHAPTSLELSNLCFRCIELGSNLLRLLIKLHTQLPVEYATYPECEGVLRTLRAEPAIKQT